MKSRGPLPATGLMVEVYRGADGVDCTNGGITAAFGRLVLLDGAISAPFTPSVDMPALRLVRRVIGGRPYIHAVPVDPEWGGDGGWLMFGGNYIATSDSRFAEICQYPIPVHDRRERSR